MAPRSKNVGVIGVAYALAAYLLWGLTPIYWKELRAFSGLEILAQRVVWSLLFLAILIAIFRQWSAVRRVIGSWRRLAPLIVTAVLVSFNWGVYIWTVNAGNVLEASLGYFMTPLMSVLLGVIFLRERLRLWQGLAVLLAGAGVVILTVSIGVFPWVGLSLAVSFGFYGLIRKIVPTEPLVGLITETTLLLPVALVYIAYISATGTAVAKSADLGLWLLLIGGGVVTSLPLLWFAQAAKRLQYSTLGLVQYVAPSIQFMLAVFLYGERFTNAHLVTFACIWGGLVIYTVDVARIYRRSQTMVTPPPE
ncbi:MAG: EamA family transporter RarD [Alphaproteobacteria bacterium]|nr:EamA family transporter RarD [Alphaproteobacteria bacterium]